MSSPHEPRTPSQNSDHFQYKQYPLSGTSIDHPVPGSSSFTQPFSGDLRPIHTDDNTTIGDLDSCRRYGGTLDDLSCASQPTAPSGELEDGKSESEESKSRSRQQKNKEVLYSLLFPDGRADDSKDMVLKLPSPSSIRDKRSQRSRRGRSVSSGISKSYQHPASRQPTNGHTGKTTRIRRAGEKSKSGDQRSVGDGDSVMSVEGQSSPSGTGADDEVMGTELSEGLEDLSVNE